PRLPEDLGAADVVIVDPRQHGDHTELAHSHPGVAFGRFVEVVDAASLELACRWARTDPWTVLLFRDPTRIPLEIVLAAADGATGNIITVVDDPAEASVIFGVLERGSDGVMMAPRGVGDASRLKAAAETRLDDLQLVELEIAGVTHVGMGERACIDTCT